MTLTTQLLFFLFDIDHGRPGPAIRSAGACAWPCSGGAGGGARGGWRGQGRTSGHPAGGWGSRRRPHLQVTAPIASAHRRITGPPRYLVTLTLTLSHSLSLSDPPSLRTHTRTLFLPRLTRALTLALPPSLCSRDVPIRADSARLTRTVEINKHKVDFQHTRHALDGAALRASRACVGFHRCSRIYGKGPEDWKGGMDLGALVAGEQTGEPGRRSSGVFG